MTSHAPLADALVALSGSELSTLLLEVASRRAAAVQPQRLLATSAGDPVQHAGRG